AVSGAGAPAARALAATTGRAPGTGVSRAAGASGGGATAARAAGRAAARRHPDRGGDHGHPGARQVGLRGDRAAAAAGVTVERGGGRTMDRTETETTGTAIVSAKLGLGAPTLAVSSAAFGSGAPIPAAYAGAHGRSPALRWSAPPASAREL